jgi:hypothetical protein
MNQQTKMIAPTNPRMPIRPSMEHLLALRGQCRWQAQPKH